MSQVVALLIAWSWCDWMFCSYDGKENWGFEFQENKSNANMIEFGIEYFNLKTKP